MPYTYTEPNSVSHILHERFIILIKHSDLIYSIACAFDKHASSGILIALGEFKARIVEHIKLGITPLGRFLNECRHYRNLRHGTKIDKKEGDIIFTNHLGI